MSGYCPTDPCRPCERTEPLNICLATLTINGLNASEAVELRFNNMADNATLVAFGTTDINGVLTIAAVDLPKFCWSVNYRLTAVGYDFCYIVSFGFFMGATALVQGTAETLTTC